MDIKQVPNFLIFALGAAITGLLVYLSFFNTPAVLDDYCFALTARQYGFWEAQKMYYTGWTGRYFAVFLYHINPLYLTDSRTPFIIIPILLQLGFIANVYYFTKHFFAKHAFLLAVAFCSIYYLNAPSVLESIFWYSGTYTFVSANLIILLITLLSKYYQFNGSKIKLLPILVIYFFILGSSEISMVACTVFLGLATLKYIVENKKISLELTLLGIVTIIGDALVVFSPGNAIRTGEKKNIFQILIDTVPLAFNQFAEWTFLSPLLLFSTLAFMVYSINNKPFRKGNILYSVIVFTALLYSVFIPSSYGMGGETPPRVQNLIFVLFLLGWFFLVGLISSKLNITLPVSPNILAILFTIGFMVVAYNSTNLREMYKDIRLGKASSYLAEYENRVNLLKLNNEEILYLPAIKSRPYIINTGGEITEDPKYLWNKCLGEYYNKKEIYLEK